MNNKNIRFEIVSTSISPFTYRDPIISIDENGEPQVNHLPQRGNAIHIKKITFLNLVGRDPKGKIISYEAMDHVNRFLLAHHIDDDNSESDQYSKGLIHFFSFLIALQEEWDNSYDEDVFDELIDPPRPEWHIMAHRKSMRTTYMYRQALKDAVLKERDKELRIARTTASAYMNAVIKFYSFHLRHGFIFNNPPFEHEVVNIHFQSSETNMKAYMSKAIHTTDLRLNFPKSKRNEGGAFPSSRKDLRHLTNPQWQEVEKILLTTRKVIKSVEGRKKLVALAEEYCLFFLVSRYTGLRREEVASLHSEQIVNPDLNKPMLRLGVGADYGSLTKGKDNLNKSRKTIIPSDVMRMLHEYTRSSRYKKRLKKFKELCKHKREKGEISFFESEDGVDETKNYLFISNTGHPFFSRLNTINGRWAEIRNTVNEVANVSMDATVHNLRSTFAVAVFRALLKKIDADTALALVSELLGHEELKTTLLYLKIAEDEPTGDEIYEDVLDYVGVFDDLNELQIKPKLNQKDGC